MSSTTGEKTRKHNNKLLDDFIKDKIRIDHINEISQRTIKHTLQPFINYNKKTIDFYKNITEDQIIDYIENYGITSRRVVISRLKEFCRFVHKLETDDKLPDSIRRIKPPTKREIQKVTPPNIEHKLITVEEYNLLITKGSSHPMDKALVETLYLFGCRPSELTAMDMKHVKEETDKGLITITVPKSKTKPRDISVNTNAQYLLDWLHVYSPNKNKPNEPLWINKGNKDNGKRLQTWSVWAIVKTMSKHAGITRHIHPYMLRHSSVTRDRNKAVPITHLESKFGWIKGTSMLRTYDHNGTEDLKKYLIETAQEKPQTYTALKNVTNTIEQRDEKINEKLKEKDEQIQQLITNDEINKRKLEEMEQKLNKLEEIMERTGQSPETFIKVNDTIYQWDEDLDVYIIRAGRGKKRVPQFLDKDKNPLKDEKGKIIFA